MTWYKWDQCQILVRRENPLKTKRAILCLFGVIYLTACATTPSPTASEVPTEVPAQPTSDATISLCDPAQFIDVLREAVPYDESVVGYNHYDDSADLTVWFVDPVLDPQALESEIQGLTELTFRHSVEVANLLATAEPCITALFDSFTVIAVDRLYHAWYVGAIPAFEIPVDEISSEDGWVELEGKFAAGYQRKEKVLDGDPPEIPEESCTWPEARQDLEQTFTQVQKNVAIYYYIEPEDASVYVQWDIPPAAQNAQQILDYFFLPLPYIDSAISCLYPEFDTLWLFYIRPDGEAQWVFAVDGDAVRDDDHQVFIDNLELIYQTATQ
jgi:hypothetical protein